MRRLSWFIFSYFGAIYSQNVHPSVKSQKWI